MLSISNLTGELTFGRMPEKDDEVVISGYDDGWTFGEDPEKLIGMKCKVTADDGSEHRQKIRYHPILCLSYCDAAYGTA